MPRRAAKKDGRGSRPGERRGGREKGTPNKRTAALRAALLTEFERSGGTPLDVMLAVMRNPALPLQLRIDCESRALLPSEARPDRGSRGQGGPRPRRAA